MDIDNTENVNTLNENSDEYYSDEYNSEEEESKYLREILKNKKNDDNDIDIDEILIKNKKNTILKTVNKKHIKPKNIISDIFKNEENTNLKHKYYFKPRLPPIFKD